MNGKLIGRAEGMESKQLMELKAMVKSVQESAQLICRRTKLYEGEEFQVKAPVFVQYHTFPEDGELEKGGFHIFACETGDADNERDIWLINTISERNSAVYHMEDVLLLLIEYLYPGKFAYWESDKHDLENHVIPALQWMKQQFPEEDFGRILRHRVDSQQLRLICWNAFPESDGKRYECYQNLCLNPSPEIIARYVCRSSHETLMSMDQDTFNVDYQSHDGLDQKYEVTDRGELRMALFVLCLCRELKKNFISDGNDTGYGLNQAVRSLNLLRNGGSGEQEEWSRYRFPVGVIYQLTTLPSAAFIPILEIVFDVSGETAQQALNQGLFGRGEQARNAMWKALDSTLLEKWLRQMQKKPKDYFSQTFEKDAEWLVYKETLVSGLGEVAAVYREQLTLHEIQKDRKAVLLETLRNLRDMVGECMSETVFREIVEKFETNEEVYATILAMRRIWNSKSPYFSRKRQMAMLALLEHQGRRQRYLGW